MTQADRKYRAPFEGGYYSLNPVDIDKLVDFHKNNEPPYLIMKLGKNFSKLSGFRYVQLDMTANISGYIKNIKNIKKQDKDEYMIYLNKREPLTRIRFTAAHELAHLLLHEDKIGDGIYDDVLYRSSLSTLEEVQANKLAADILMPMWKIKEFVDSGKRLRDLPEIFNVSRIAVCIRLDINEFILFNS